LRDLARLRRAATGAAAYTELPHRSCSSPDPAQGVPPREAPRARSES